MDCLQWLFCWKVKLTEEASEGQSNRSVAECRGESSYGSVGAGVEKNGIQGKNPQGLISNVRKEKKNQDQAVEELFQKYKSSEGDYIGPDEMENFCSELGFEPSHLKALILAWQLTAQEMGYFHHEEFVYGLRRLGVYSLDDLRSNIQQCYDDITTFQTPDHFSKLSGLHRFAFNYCKESKASKTVDIDTAITMLTLIFNNNQVIASFVKFLTLSRDIYRGLNFDQWVVLLDFVSTFSSGKFEGYDPNSAWPTIFDHFVQWETTQKNQHA